MDKHNSIEQAYRELRDEWDNNKLLKAMVKNVCGSICYNCGSTENIEYHHIVPLKLGGTNNISNIAALCNRCHKAAHYGRHIRDYCNKKVSGRPHKVPVEEINKALNDFISGIIGTKECKTRMGLSQKSHIADMSYYKRYLKEHSIKSFHNDIDMIIYRYGEVSEGDKVGEIVYFNDNIEEIYYKKA